MADWKRIVRVFVYAFLAVVSLTGTTASILEFLLAKPARGVTGRFEVAAEFHSAQADSTSRMLNALPMVFPASAKDGPTEPLRDSIATGRLLAAPAVMAIHLVNIFLILSAPVGGLLFGVLFAVLILLEFMRDSFRLRNTAMAVGTAFWVFALAIPGSVLISGFISGAYSGPLRYASALKLEAFRSEYSSLWHEWAGEEGKELDGTRFEVKTAAMAKGLPGYVIFASISLIVDCVLLPVLLSWALYRLGLFLANTCFGTFRMSRMGETMKRIIQRASTREAAS